MAGVLDLRDVFQLVVDSLDKRALRQQEPIKQGQEFVFHIPAHFGDELYTLLPELIKECLGDIAPIAKEFPKQSLRQLRYRVTVIDVTCRDFHSQQLPLVIDN